MKNLISLFIVGQFLVQESSAVNINLIAREHLSHKSSKAWRAYREARGEHDCNINEQYNWLGN